jgi:hypothetical protein
MGKRLSGCDTSAEFPSQGVGFMPMIQMMMGGWSSPMGSNQSNNSIQTALQRALSSFGLARGLGLSSAERQARAWRWVMSKQSEPKNTKNMYYLYTVLCKNSIYAGVLL